VALIALDLNAKRLEILAEFLPRPATVLILADPASRRRWAAWPACERLRLPWASRCGSPRSAGPMTSSARWAKRAQRASAASACSTWRC